MNKITAESSLLPDEASWTDLGEESKELCLMNKITAESSLLPDEESWVDLGEESKDFTREVAVHAVRNKLYVPTYKLFKPLCTVKALIDNKRLTGAPLTTTLVFAPMVSELKDSKNSNIMFWETIFAHAALKADIYQKMTSKIPHVTLIHITTRKQLPHSTMLTIGTLHDGTSFAIFFDVQGDSPSWVTLDTTQIEDPSFKTVVDLYDYLMHNLHSIKPYLLYNHTNIQKDWCSCTAYSALFAKKILASFQDKTLNPRDFIKKVASGQVLHYNEVRKLVLAVRR